ncbi:UNVERIFIED_CONTAM: hypothetical protein Scaly_2239400 [Sesamum calycinum]|uniref:Uncharacterized protein n=1 Tax=Sesamum calycinum TaxID=2727403 RepID=A0AAW2MAS1_9LAMI
MGRLLFAFVVLSTLFLLMLHTTADGAGCSEPDTPYIRSRSLLQSPGTEKSKAKAPAEKVDDHRGETAEAPDSMGTGKHRSLDRSVAGGGVIVGGLVTATLAAVYCYIRVTRRRHG